MSLKRDELERELVRYDKQKLITKCLAVFDSNVQLVEELEAARRVGKQAKADAIEAIKERRRLERRTVWQVINERLAARVEKIKARNEQRRLRRDKTYI